MSLEYKIFSSDYQAQDVTKVNTGDSVQEAGEDGKGEGIENVIPVEAKEVRGMLQRLQWTGGISSMKNLYFQKIFYGTFWYFIVLFRTSPSPLCISGRLSHLWNIGTPLLLRASLDVSADRRLEYT